MVLPSVARWVLGAANGYREMTRSSEVLRTLLRRYGPLSRTLGARGADMDEGRPATRSERDADLDRCRHGHTAGEECPTCDTQVDTIDLTLADQGPDLDRCRHGYTASEECATCDTPFTIDLTQVDRSLLPHRAGLESSARPSESTQGGASAPA